VAEVAIIALCSAKGSPGVTTTGLAFCLSWSRRSILAECDPAGGDVLAGFLQANISPDRGVEKLAAAAMRDRLVDDFWGQLIDLEAPRGARLLLPGVNDPARAAGLAYIWQQLGDYFAALENANPAFDVIVDCGRLVTANAPTPLVHRADLVLLVARTNLPSLSAAAVAAVHLRADLAEHGGADALGLITITDGSYRPSEVASAFAAVPGGVEVPVIASLPDDATTAKEITLGGMWRPHSRLQKAAAAAEAAVFAAVTARRLRLSSPMSTYGGADRG
jgi:hypothetical protein